MSSKIEVVNKTLIKVYSNVYGRSDYIRINAISSFTSCYLDQFTRDKVEEWAFVILSPNSASTLHYKTKEECMLDIEKLIQIIG